MFKTGITLTETVPLNMMELYASITGNLNLKAQATFGKGLSKKMFDMQGIFFHFINNMWNF